MFACEQERVAPDLMCVAKGLTGGYLPLAATLATERIYEGFLGAHEDFRTFFHGVTTRVTRSLRSGDRNLDVFETEGTLLSSAEDPAPRRAPRGRRRCPRSRGALPWVHRRNRPRQHHPALRLGIASRSRPQARRDRRPLGDTVVLMPPLAISKAELRRLVAITAASITAACAEVRGASEPGEAAGGGAGRGVAPRGLGPRVLRGAGGYARSRRIAGCFGVAIKGVGSLPRACHSGLTLLWPRQSSTSCWDPPPRTTRAALTLS